MNQNISKEVESNLLISMIDRLEEMKLLSKEEAMSIRVEIRQGEN